MRYLFLFLLTISLFFTACKKAAKSTATTTAYTNTAVIKGPSLFMTACGGAYWIVIDTVSARTTFNSLPAGSGIDLSTATFPINVKLNWHYETPNTCAIIVIDAIERVD